ncbi:MAG: fibronectin type III domain-containing protein, partial [Draconibacterium sp.]|nr:fibronectin type III domain-containing protein [Draconibacterium sp.]
SRLIPYEISSGLNNSNIAIWNSHGWYYEAELDRWEWQRPRLFTTVEDISPSAFVVQYIALMLENAGANTFIPRERDWQTNEVIVDNNASTGKSKFKKPKGRKTEVSGFAIGNPPYINENPFEIGTSINFKSSKKFNKAVYIPEIPETGYYPVYVSYGRGDGKVIYSVYHSGGKTDFEVDQRMGYGTWIYLGKFHFKQGINKKAGKVELVVPEGNGRYYSTDAVRFGGGIGDIERNGKISQRARFYEGARYYLQYAGVPDTLVYKLHENNDYSDDSMGRGEWVNWLLGAPFGPTKNRQHPGLKIPIDMAFAFHTDAGILPDDEIVGTLAIYSTDRDTSVFSDGQSKYASRDLTDIIQTQIVDDINTLYNCDWTRRGMWNAQYFEAYRPQVPTMMLELLSHQNLNDVKYLLQPKFKFDVSRAVYKGILRYIASQNNYEYVIQPLPVDHFSSEFVNQNSVKLSWTPVLDKLEPTAIPEKYLVYERIGKNGFDNGTLVNKPEIIISNLEKGKVYGFKVTAVNSGGESFPSEIISVGIAKKSKGEILIVNGFDRLDAPAVFENNSRSGVDREQDQGVAYNFDIATTGDQYEFRKRARFVDDDNPGHGASNGELETTVFRANTFDFSNTHGKSILENGFSFATTSDEAVEKGMVSLNKYLVLDLLYGEEKTTIFPGGDKSKHFQIYTDKMLRTLREYTQNGGSIMISGAYIGTEIQQKEEQIAKLFGYKWYKNHASKSGHFHSDSNDFNISGEFNIEYNIEHYPVEASDGIDPVGQASKTFLRYSENNISAGVIYEGNYNVVALGFPFEC